MTYKSKYITALIVLSLSVYSISYAGQVVTDNLKLWAKRAIQNEKKLSLSTEKNTLAVLYFANRTGNGNLSVLEKGLAVMLISDLSQIEGLQVLERIRLQALLDELNLSVSGLVDSQTAVRMGKLMGAKYLLGGDIISFMQGIKLEANLINVPQTRTIAESNASGQLKELFKLEKSLLTDIIKVMKIELTERQRTKIMQPFSKSFDAAWLFFIGIDKSDKGQYDDAANYYKKALEKDPDLISAQKALKELHNLNLIDNNKRKNFLKSLRNKTSLTDQLRPNYPIKRTMQPGEIQTRSGSESGNESGSESGSGSGSGSDTVGSPLGQINQAIDQ